MVPISIEYQATSGAKESARPPGDISVALVYPPYGPAGLPSLGLAILSAGIKSRGFRCRTFYWNLDFVRDLPGDGLASQLGLYRLLNGRSFLPLNEWVFAGMLYGHGMADRDAELTQQLETFIPPNLPLEFTKFDLLRLRERAPNIVARMIDQLESYDVIGINSTFFQNLPALALAKAAKARWPQKIIVLGGANCDGPMGATLLAQYPFLDYVFSGEVDHAFPDFVGRLASGEREKVADLRGILFRSDAGLGRGLAPAPLQDLDGLPIPDFDDYVAARTNAGMDENAGLCLPLESSRGCWWGAKQHCTFCGLNANGMAYRQKSPDRFYAEVETVVKRFGPRFLFMADNILSMNFYHNFLDRMIEKNPNVNFFYEIKANVSRKQVEQLARARVTLVQPGIESFSTRILQRMRKGTTAIRNVALLKYAREYGILLTYNLLAGFPGEEQEEYAAMAAQLPALTHLQPPNGLSPIEFHRFSPYHSDAAKYDLHLQASPKYRYLYPFSKDVLDNLAYVFEPCAEGAETNQEYLNELRAQVKFWQQRFDFESCLLTWCWSGSDIVVDDRRPRLGPRRYRLRDFAVAVLRLTDDPRSLSGLIEAASGNGCSLDEADVMAMLTTFSPPPACTEEQMIGFTKTEFLQDSSACLASMIKADLLFVEGNSYLALPVRRSSPEYAKQWYQLGI